jgi:hypothetical protein
LPRQADELRCEPRDGLIENWIGGVILEREHFQRERGYRLGWALEAMPGAQELSSNGSE